MHDGNCRIAILTNEFAWPNSRSGGLGTFLARLMRAFQAVGCEPELFVLGDEEPSVRSLDGMRVETVRPVRDFWFLVLRRLTWRRLRGPWGGPQEYLAGAVALRRALERRHSEKPFDIVHSTNCGATGLLVKKRRGRAHLMRLSSHRGLWFDLDGRGDSPGERLMCWMEAACARRADAAYAPSRFLARYSAEDWGLPVEAVAPPLLNATGRSELPDIDLPDRYLFHFGQLNPRKGTDVVAKALVRAWREEPELRMVWAGPMADEDDWERYGTLWGERADQVVWPGSLPKPAVYGLIEGATACVLPSRVDNLPNTVIESLMFGVPVVGSDGASIDELVEPGRNGWLVPIGDADALAETMVRVWRGEGEALKAAFQRPALFDDMQPETAARAVLELAGC